MYYIKPAKGFLTSLFSNSRKNPVLGIIRPHQGIDISGDTDNTIIAAASGKVRVADNAGKTGFGKYIVITHPNGQESLYGHLSAVNVKIGQSVSQGQKIGVKGTTGNSTGLHLHFEISKGRWTNDFSNKLDPLLLFIDPVTKEIQQMLNKLGHNLVADGIYGNGTITAVSSFQKSCNLGVDGVCGRGTFANLEKKSASNVPSTPETQTKPQPQKESVKMLKSTSATLDKGFIKYLEDAVKAGHIQDKWVKLFKDGKLPIDDAFLLDIHIREAKEKK